MHVRDDLSVSLLFSKEGLERGDSRERGNLQRSLTFETML